MFEFRQVEEGNPTYTEEDGILYKDGKKTLYAYPAGKPETSFTVPEGVTIIYDGAFFSAFHLEEIQFPSTLQYIGAGAFDFCTEIQSIDLPEGLEIIYENAFSDCEKLSSVKLPESLKGIGNYAFYACPALKEITIPKNCNSVGEYSFGYTDGTEKDENGNPVPVKIEGFKKHKNINLSSIMLIASGILLLITIILILVRIIQKNQMSPEEHQEIKNAELKEEDNQYVKILDEINSENANKNQDKQQDEHKE